MTKTTYKTGDVNLESRSKKIQKLAMGTVTGTCVNVPYDWAVRL